MDSETTTVNLQSLASGFALLAKLPEYEARIAALERQIQQLKDARAVDEKPVIPKGRKWATMKEAMEFLGCSEDTVTRYIKRGLLRRNNALRHVQILVEDLGAFAGKVTFKR